MSLLPEEIDAGAVGPVDGVMAVLAIKGERLFVVRSNVGEASQAEMHVDCLPIMPDQVSVSVIDNPQNMADAVPPGHFRRWVFSWSAGSRVELLGEVRRMRQWSNGGADGAELFAQAIARRLGWDVPPQD